MVKWILEYQRNPQISRSSFLKLLKISGSRKKGERDNVVYWKPKRKIKDDLQEERSATHDSSITRQHFKFLVALMTRFGQACTKSRDRALDVVMLLSSAGIMMALQTVLPKRSIAQEEASWYSWVQGTVYIMHYSMLIWSSFVILSVTTSIVKEKESNR